MYSRFIDSEHGLIAKAFYDINGDKRKYHNWNHVLENDKCLKNIKTDYDINLDFANMWHDAVYDELPNKELRSATMFYNIYSSSTYTPFRQNFGLNIDKVHRLITETTDHIYTDNYLMVYTDLHAFESDELRKRNRKNLYEENNLFYGIDKETFFNNSISFLQGLSDRVKNNRKYKYYFTKILEGIDKEIIDHRNKNL